MDTVFIHDLPVDTIIGVYEEERRQKQTLLVSLEMACNSRPAAATDDLSEALDYHAISRRVESRVSESRVQLLESLANQLADTLMREFSIPWLQLTINKPAALPAASATGLKIERGRRP